MTRRSLFTLAVPLAMSPLAATARAPELCVEGYIFQQYAESRRQPLAAVVAETLAMARAAGFHRIELSPAFFTPDLRTRVLALLRAQQLRMPSVYVGGPLHTPEAAAQTTALALATHALCAPFGCRAVVHNPDPKSGGLPKTDAELAIEADSLNTLARRLAQRGCELRVHHHTPQLENHAREWRFLLSHTDPAIVRLCVDVDWAYEGGFEPLAFLAEAGPRLAEIHVRSARNKVWLEDVEDSDIDYRQVAAYLQRARLHPQIVVELAYRPNTAVTRSLQEDLLRSRLYTERVFRRIF